MNGNILGFIRSQVWAILPEYLEAIEAVAMRMMESPSLAMIEMNGHIERMSEASARMGERAPSTRTASMRDGVGMLPVMGPIFPRATMLTQLSGATSLDLVAADLRALQANPEIRNILMVLDTPGGVTTGANDMAHLIATSEKPISVHVTGMCCSLGYWLGSQASGGISTDPTGIVGSIGVLMSSSYQEGPDQNGRRAVDIVSSNAPNKRPDLSTEEGRAQIRQMLDGIESVFISNVARGRGVTEATVRNEFGAGGTKTGRQAKEAGMIDRIEPTGLEGAIRRLARTPAPAPSRRTAATNKLAAFRAAL